MLIGSSVNACLCRTIDTSNVQEMNKCFLIKVLIHAHCSVRGETDKVAWLRRRLKMFPVIVLDFYEPLNLLVTYLEKRSFIRDQVNEQVHALVTSTYYYAIVVCANDTDNRDDQMPIVVGDILQVWNTNYAPSKIKMKIFKSGDTWMQCQSRDGMRGGLVPSRCLRRLSADEMRAISRIQKTNVET